MNAEQLEAMNFHVLGSSGILDQVNGIGRWGKPFRVKPCVSRMFYVGQKVDVYHPKGGKSIGQFEIVKVDAKFIYANDLPRGMKRGDFLIVSEVAV